MENKFKTKVPEMLKYLKLDDDIEKVLYEFPYLIDYFKSKSS